MNKVLYYCEKCGKPVYEKYGSSRFCSRFCANSHIQTPEINKKRSDKLKGKDKSGNIIIPKYCKSCGKLLKNNNKSGYCSICVKSCEERRDIRVRSGKRAYELSIKHCKFKGWQSRNIISYPEQFFMKVLDSNNIKYEHNKPVVRTNGLNYFLDFYIKTPYINLDLEIDGKQHKYEARAKSDMIRNAELEKLGYTTYRIDWNEINSEKGKLEMSKKIESFLTYYRALCGVKVAC